MIEAMMMGQSKPFPFKFSLGTFNVNTLREVGWWYIDESNSKMYVFIPWQSIYYELIYDSIDSNYENFNITSYNVKHFNTNLSISSSSFIPNLKKTNTNTIEAHYYQYGYIYNVIFDVVNNTLVSDIQDHPYRTTQDFSNGTTNTNLYLYGTVFNSDGTKVVCAYYDSTMTNSDRYGICQFVLTTAYDLSTVDKSQTTYYTDTNFTTTPMVKAFSPDGTKVYFDLNTNNFNSIDIASDGTFSNLVVNAFTVGAAFNKFQFINNGNNILTSTTSNPTTFYNVPLTTAYDLSTYDDTNKSVGGKVGSDAYAQNAIIRTDLSGLAVQTQQYTSAYLNNLNENSFPVTDTRNLYATLSDVGTAVIYNSEISTDGTEYYVLAGGLYTSYSDTANSNHPYFYVYKLSTAFDMTTATLSSKTDVYSLVTDFGYQGYVNKLFVKKLTSDTYSVIAVVNNVILKFSVTDSTATMSNSKFLYQLLISYGMCEFVQNGEAFVARSYVNRGSYYAEEYTIYDCTDTPYDLPDNIPRHKTYTFDYYDYMFDSSSKVCKYSESELYLLSNYLDVYQKIDITKVV